ncbi:MAG: hypothetical protein ACRYG8_41205 [Janthinobacterium lividum]
MERAAGGVEACGTCRMRSVVGVRRAAAGPAHDRGDASQKVIRFRVGESGAALHRIMDDDRDGTGGASVMRARQGPGPGGLADAGVSARPWSRRMACSWQAG